MAVYNARVRLISEEDFLTRWWSGFDREIANDYALRMSNYALGSEGFRALVRAISVETADSLASVLETTIAEVANGTSECLMQFTEVSWPNSLSSLYREHLRAQDVQFENEEGGVVEPISTAQLALTHGRAFSGIAIVASSQIAKRILAQFISKIPARAGMVIIPYVGGIIGMGMIVADVVANKDGAIRLIERKLTAAAQMADLRVLLSQEIIVQVEKESPKIALAVANETYASYTTFKQNWKNVIGWSEKNESFNRLLDVISTHELIGIANWLSVLTLTRSQDDIAKIIDNGDFENLLNLPDDAIFLLEMTGDPELVFEWWSLAGPDNLKHVVESHLPTIADPDDFDSRHELTTLLEADLKRDDVRWMTQLPTGHRRFLLARGPIDLPDVIDIVKSDGASWLLPLLSELSIQLGNSILNRLLTRPHLLQKINRKSLATAISNDDTERYLNSLERGLFLDKTIVDVDRYKEGLQQMALFRAYPIGVWVLGLSLSLVGVFLGRIWGWMRSLGVHRPARGPQ